MRVGFLFNSNATATMYSQNVDLKSVKCEKCGRKSGLRSTRFNFDDDDKLRPISKTFRFICVSRDCRLSTEITVALELPISA